MNSYKLKILAANTINSLLPLKSVFRLLKKRYILAYHRVIPASIAHDLRMQNSMWVSTETFTDDIKWMKKQGDIVDLNTILDFNLSHKKPLFSITFDDGWLDNYEYAFPILRSNAIPATIFLVTGSVESGRLFWVEDFLYKVALMSATTPEQNLSKIILSYYSKAGAKEPNIFDAIQLAEGFAELLKPLQKEERDELLHDLYMDLGLDIAPINNHILSWSNITEMYAHGIEFGTHTHTHEILQYAENQIIEKELRISREILTAKLGKPVKYFCYPNARYRESNLDLIKRAGYEYAFRIHNMCVTKEQNRYLIPRYIMNEMACQNKNFLLCRLLNFPKF